MPKGGKAFPASFASKPRLRRVFSKGSTSCTVLGSVVDVYTLSKSKSILEGSWPSLLLVRRASTVGVNNCWSVFDDDEVRAGAPGRDRPSRRVPQFKHRLLHFLLLY